MLDRLPRGPGVYLFIGDKDVPLYVGKSVDNRSRVLSHFSDAKRSDKELRMSQEVRDIEWIETAGYAVTRACSAGTGASTTNGDCSWPTCKEAEMLALTKMGLCRWVSA